MQNKDLLTEKIIGCCFRVHCESQVLSYLKASGLKIGLLVNFGTRKSQVKRLVV